MAEVKVPQEIAMWGPYKDSFDQDWYCLYDPDDHPPEPEVNDNGGYPLHLPGKDASYGVFPKEIAEEIVKRYNEHNQLKLFR